MLKGKKIILRPMVEADIERQHAFNQDLELFGLDSSYPMVSPIESARSFYERRTKFDKISLHCQLKRRENILVSVLL